MASASEAALLVECAPGLSYLQCGVLYGQGAGGPGRAMLSPQANVTHVHVSWEVETPFTWLSATLTQVSRHLSTPRTKKPRLLSQCLARKEQHIISAVDSVPLWEVFLITTEEVNGLASPQPAVRRLACSWLKYLEE